MGGQREYYERVCFTNIAAASGHYPTSGNYSVSVTGAATDGAYPIALTLPDGSTVYGSATADQSVSDFVGNTKADGSGTSVDTGLSLTFGTLSYSPSFAESGVVTEASAATGESPGRGHIYDQRLRAHAVNGSYPISIQMPDGTTLTGTAADGTVSDLVSTGGTDTGLNVTLSGLSWNAGTSTGSTGTVTVSGSGATALAIGGFDPTSASHNVDHVQLFVLDNGLRFPRHGPRRNSLFQEGRLYLTRAHVGLVRGAAERRYHHVGRFRDAHVQYQRRFDSRRGGPAYDLQLCRRADGTGGEPCVRLGLRRRLDNAVLVRLQHGLPEPGRLPAGRPPEHLRKPGRRHIGKLRQRPDPEALPAHPCELQ